MAATTTLTLRDSLIGTPTVVRRALTVIAGAALISLFAQISIPLSFTPVPITGQTFAVLLVGTALGTVDGTASTALYILAGALGAPIYAAHAHGVEIIRSPSGGYLIGFVVAAALSGYLAERGWDRHLNSSISAMLTGNVIIYAFGITWLAHELHVSISKAFELGLYPFVPGDLLKLYLAGAVLPTVWRYANRRT